jgi:hypothetical protein
MPPRSDVRGGELQPAKMSAPSTKITMGCLCNINRILLMAPGHWSLASGFWSLVTGHWSLVTGIWSLAYVYRNCTPYFSLLNKIVQRTEDKCQKTEVIQHKIFSV